MNENLFRTQFDQLETTEKQALMESLATRYDMTFLGLHTFDRWGQNCTTGIFEKDDREFVFVPGDTITLGWERFAVGLSQDSREELDYLFQEWEMEQDPEEMIRESMALVRQAAIGPMLVGRELEELCWELVTMDDPRLTAHPDWLKQFREFAWSDLAKTGLSTKDFIAPTSFTFSKDGKTFRIGEYSGAMSFLQILAPELTDRMLAEFLDLDDAVTVNLHIQSIDQATAIRNIKRKMSDLQKMKIEEQKKAVRGDAENLQKPWVVFSF